MAITQLCRVFIQNNLIKKPTNKRNEKMVSFTFKTKKEIYTPRRLYSNWQLTSSLSFTPNLRALFPAKITKFSHGIRVWPLASG